MNTILGASGGLLYTACPLKAVSNRMVAHASHIKSANLLVISEPGAPELAALKGLPPSVRTVAVGQGREDLKASVEELATVDIVLNTGFGVRHDQRKVLQDLWPHMRQLKWVHAASAGVGHLLFEDLTNSDVILTNAKGLFSNSLAEYALASCSYFAKQLGQLRANQEAATWKPLYVEELKGRRMGVIGFGSIGQACARLGKAYGMSIAALRRRTKLSAEEEQSGLEVYKPDELNELMASCDYIVLALPATPATYQLVDERAIAAMKSNAVLINVGRGTTIDEQALTTALQEKRIKGAALDVFHEEPLPQTSPLWKLDNVLISPHCADRTSDFMFTALQQFVDIAQLYTEGKELQNVCDKSEGY